MISPTPEARRQQPGLWLGATGLGFVSLAGQVIFLRELASSLGGNELALGLLLGSWLLWTGAGSMLADKVRWHNPLAPAIAYAKLGVLFPLTLLAIRLVRPLLGLLPGEVVGLTTLLPIVLVIVAPFGFITGALFVLLSRTYFQTGANRVYLLEALGAVLGGVTTTFLFIPFLTNLAISLLAGCICLGIGFGLSVNRSRPFSWLVGVLIAGFVLLSLLIQRPLERWSLAQQWKGFELIASENSPYGAITAVRQAEQVSLFQQGGLVFSCPDPLSAEEAVHFGLLEHSNPKTALLIGNGLGGSIAEALKYRDLTVDYVDLDPKLLSLSRSLLSEQGYVKESRVRIHLTDARRSLKGSSARYDVILLNLPVPSTAQLNRFYTKEFFALAKAHLSSNGILAFRLPSQENYLSPELAEFLASMKRTLQEVFPEVTVLPGGSAVFLASSTPHALTRDPDTIIARLGERAIPTVFVSASYLPDRLAPFRLERLDAALDRARTQINTDERPICYYFDALLLASHFRSAEKALVAFLARVPLWAFALLFCLGLALLLLKGPSGKPLLAIASAGAISLALEVLCLVAFQNSSGALYSGIGLLFAAFMAGLALGAWIFQREVRQSLLALKLIQGALVVLPLICLLFIQATAFLEGTLLSDHLFAFFLGIAGLVCGAAFPVANGLYLRSRPQALGTAYGLDLLAACLGALLTSAVLLPLHGMTATLLFLSFLALLPLLAFLI